MNRNSPSGVRLNDQRIPYLEHFPDLDRPPQRIKLAPIPFQIGRQATADYVIHSQRVSKNHAQIMRKGDRFVIVDQDSTNGTFVNGQRIKECGLQPNDIIHIAHKEIRFRLEVPEVDRPSVEHATCEGAQALTDSLIRGWEILREVIRNRMVKAVFQPIVQIKTEEVVGFELLTRITHPELSESPAATLAMADKFQLAPVVSRMFRTVGLEDAKTIPGTVNFFFNLHPSEFLDFSLVESLAETAALFRANGRCMVLEIHEDAIANTPMVYELRKLLRKHGILLAFDDFGAGQTRLAQLADAAPDFLKLDMHLIRGINMAPARQDLVRALTEFAAGLNVDVIAEGVETRAEADTCSQLGCTLAQGYLFGRPAAAKTFCVDDPTKTRQETDVLPRALVRKLIPQRRID